jgi:hypothetical protein
MNLNGISTFISRLWSDYIKNGVFYYNFSEAPLKRNDLVQYNYYYSLSDDQPHHQVLTYHHQATLLAILDNGVSKK